MRGASGRANLEWDVRSVNPSDRKSLETLKGLIADSMDSAEGSWSPSSIFAAVATPGARVWLAERGNGVLLGFVLARRIVDLLEIDLVGVRAEHRRSGIASSLLAGLIEDETGAGLVEARLELAVSNGPACHLYEGLGFMVVGRRTRYYPDGDDALLLSLMISRGRSVPPQ